MGDRHSALLSGLCLAGLLSTGPVASSERASIGAYGDWQVWCDNQRACVARSITTDPSQATLEVRRDGSATAHPSWRLLVSARVRPGERLRVIEGGEAVTFYVTEGDEAGGTASLDQGSSERLVALARLENWLTVAGATVRAAASLRGLSAVLRYIDERQHRLGQVNAFHRGVAPPSVPPLPLLPEPIRALGSPAIAATAPDPVAVGRLLEGTRCLPATMGYDLQEDVPKRLGRPFRLNDQVSLVEFTCDPAPYNSLSALLMVDNSGSLSRLELDWPVDMHGQLRAERPFADGVLYNAEFDPATSTLTSSNKDHSSGQCWTTAIWRFDGTRFVLQRYEQKAPTRCDDLESAVVVFRVRE